MCEGMNVRQGMLVRRSVVRGVRKLILTTCVQ